MAMESVLKKLESRIEEFVEAHGQATAKVAELEAKVAELTEQAGGNDELSDKIAELEKQRGDMADRLEKLLGVIDSALEGGD